MNNNAFLSLELCLFFVVLMAHLLRIWASIQKLTELEELEAVLATEELLAIERVDIFECLGNEFDKSARFQSLPQ